MNPTVENVYNSGVLVEWDAANTGTRTATTYELYYRTSAENETVVYNLQKQAILFLMDAIANGTWSFQSEVIALSIMCILVILLSHR